MPPLCILIGPPGAGKSSVGASLASLLGTTFRDTDADIAERAGKSIAEIFVEDGEPIFRQFEVVAVKEAIKSHAGVLALGGGAVMNPEIQEALKTSGSKVIFLDVTIGAAAPRIGFNRDRPLLLVNPRAQWLSLMEQRRSTYETLADATVLTDGLTPQQAAESVRERVSL